MTVKIPLLEGRPRVDGAVAYPEASKAGELSAAEHDALIRGLFVDYSGILRGYILRHVKNDADAAELVQDVYARLVYRKAARKLHQAPRSYLFRTATNLVRDRHRRRKVRWADLHIPLEDEIPDSAYEGPETQLASRQLLLILQQAIRELSPKAREVFSLRFEHELTYREIGSRTNIPLRSVERYVSQALDYCSTRVASQL